MTIIKNDLTSDLKPSERFAQLAKAVIGVKKADFDKHVRENPPPPHKAGRKAKEKQSPTA